VTPGERLMEAGRLYGKEAVVRSFMAEPGVDVQQWEKLLGSYGTDAAFEEILKSFGRQPMGIGDLRQLEREPVAPPEEPGFLTRMLEQRGEMGLRQAAAQKAAGETLWEGYQWKERMHERLVQKGTVAARKARGQLPDLHTFAGVVENRKDILRPGITTREAISPMERLPIGTLAENRKTLMKLAAEGKIPRPEDIKEQFDEPYASQLIAEMRALSPRLLSRNASWQWQGEINRILPVSWISKHPYLAGALDEALVTGTGFVIDELTDPQEWALDFVGGKYFFVPAIKALRARPVFRMPISYLLRKGKGGAKPMRKFLTSELARAGAAREAVEAIAGLSDEELRAAMETVRAGKELYLQVPEEAVPEAAAGLAAPEGWEFVEPDPEAALVRPKPAQSGPDVPPESPIPDLSAKPAPPIPEPEAVTPEQIIAGPEPAIDGALPAAAPITPSEISYVVGDQDPDALAAVLERRGAPDLSDEELVEALGESLGRQTEMRNVVRKHGASSVLDEIQRGVDVAAIEQPSRLDAWRKKEGAITRAQLDAEGQSGYLRLKRGPKQPIIGDDDIRAALYAGRETAGGAVRLKRWTVEKAGEMKDFLTVEFEPKLKHAGEFQFSDDYRTGALPIPARSREQVVLDFGNIWRGLHKKQIDTALNIMGMRTWLQTLGEGIEVSRNLTAERITAELENLVTKVAADQPEILEAVGRYEEYARLVGEELVRRGKIPEEALKDFYFPHKVLEYQPTFWDKAPFRARKVRQATRPYTKTRAGSPRDIAISEDALYVHYAQVFADNMQDDWGIAQLKKRDIAPNMTKEQRKLVFGERMRPRPHGIYEVGGKKYRGYQFVPGNIVHRDVIANPTLLGYSIEDALLTDTEEVNRIFRLPQEEQFDEMMRYLENVGPRGGNALRSGRVIEGYNRVYVVPEAIYDKMGKFKDQAANAWWLYSLMGFTGWWKKWTLSPFGAGIPFQLGNLFGDGYNLYRTAPGAFKETDTAWHIVWNLSAEKRVNLSDWSKYVLRVAEDKDIFGAGFFSEYAQVHPAVSLKGFMAKWQRLGALRESWLRLAMLSYQLKRVNAGLGVIAPEFQDVIKHLDPESGAAYAARGFTVDYMAIPDWYRRYMRGMAFPFATFWQKNAVNWARYAKGAPAEFTAKFLAPQAAIWSWNNMIMGDVERKLGFWRMRPHFNIRGFDDTGDGEPNRAWVWSLDTPIDMAAQWIGLHLMADKLTRIKYGYMTPKEAALEQIFDSGLHAVPDLAERLLSPLAQIFTGMKTNRDPFTKQEIVPKELMGLPSHEKMRYWMPFAAEKLMVPFSQFMRSSEADERLFGFITKPGDIVHAAEKYVLDGPLDVPRGLGFRSIDLNQTEDRQFAAMMRDETSRWAKAIHGFEVKYLMDRRGVGEYMGSPEFAKLYKRSIEEGLTINPADVMKRLSSPRVQIERVQEMMERASGDEKRQLQRKLDALLKLRRAQSAVRVPKAARMKLLKRLQEIRKRR
jgi:hypothetical protein